MSAPSSDDQPHDPIAFNRRKWDDLAEAGDRYYRAVSPDEIANARRGDWKIRVTPQKPVPRGWFAPSPPNDNESRQPIPKVLCLAAGGGRQAPLLAAAGYDVTVFDLSEKQLERDRQIADRENLILKTVAGDMTDLSCFENESFDLIVNPCSVCFCPDVKPVWRECYRVLVEQGTLITGFINPLYYLFDAQAMDAGTFVVRHSLPYSDLDLLADERDQLLGQTRPCEFGHTLDDLIGQQLESGFAITGFFEDGWGQNDKLSNLIHLFCATRAVKVC